MKVHGLDGTRRAESHVENTKRGVNSKRDLIKKQGYFISKTGRRVEKLGNPSFSEDDILKGVRKSAQVRAERLRSNPAFIEANIIASNLRGKGKKNEDIASEMNAMGMRTPRGCLYIPASIPQLIRQGNKHFKTKN